MGPKAVYLRRPINLDDLFGHPLMSVTGEPVTPTKVAIFYLIRTLFHTHFGIRAVPSLDPFDKDEKTKAFSIIYGLILLDREISFVEFRKYVRILENELGRSIYYRFVSAMELLARGQESAEMMFENAFYTSKREHHEKVIRSDEPTLTFMSSKCFLYVWMKRVMIQYSRTPQSGIFEINENVRLWVLGKSPLTPKVPTPFAIDCSVRAREWIQEQMRLVQFCPTLAEDHTKILEWCHEISRKHVDVFHVFLLMAVVHVRRKNPPQAVRCLKKFFDLSMLQITDNTTHALKTLKIMAPCQTALRYGPILEGRVFRTFGDRSSANLLYMESIQQSQLHNDKMCNRIANLELAANDIITSGCILEAPEEKEKKDVQSSEDDRRVVQQTAPTSNDHDRPSQKTLETNFEDAYEMHNFLCTMTKLMTSIKSMMLGKCARIQGAVDRLGLIYDPNNKSRTVDDFASAIISSGFIQNGMYSQAKRVGERVMVKNWAAPGIPRMETESCAVVGVNLVYSQSAVGDFATAFSTISKLEQMFPEDVNWQSARHIAVCSKIVHFERDFLLNRYSACNDHIAGIQSTSDLEYTLRKAVILAATRRFSEAVHLLKTFKSVDVRANMRIQMQLATICTACGTFDAAKLHLDEAMKIAKGVSFRDARYLVARRVASLCLARGDTVKAYKILTALSEKVELFGTFVEKSVYYASLSRCLRLLGEDPRQSLKRCRLQIVGNRWPAMEKLILTELALIHSKTGRFPDGNKVRSARERFGILETEWPGPCSWMIV